MDGRFNFFKEVLGLVAKSDSKILEFSSFFRSKTYKSGEYFIQETEENLRVGFVERGYFRSYLSDTEGNEAIIRFIKPFEFVSGGFAFSFPSPINIQAINCVSMYEASWQEVSPFIRNNVEFMGMLQNLLSVGSTKIMRLLSDFIRLDGKQRYVLFNKEYPGMIDEIPHYYIASYLGITPVQLSRIRKQLSH